MPYTLVIRNQQAKPYCVVRQPDKGRPAETLKCYATKQEAEKYLAALRLNVEVKER